MQKHVKLLSWAADPSTEVFNGSMFLNHFAKLELLSRLGLKTSTLNLGVMWIALLGVRTILSTSALLHAASVTISFELIVWSGFKISPERPSGNVSQTLVARSCPMRTGSKVIGLIDNFESVGNVSIYPWIATWIILFNGISVCPATCVNLFPGINYLVYLIV